MYLLLLLSCVLFVFVPGNTASEEKKLTVKWPVKYTFEAEKISLTSGMLEDIQYWRTKTKSRLDFNKGAVKYVNIAPGRKTKKLRLGVKYEVHPETTKGGENILVCTRTNGSIFNVIPLQDILPDTGIFDHAGSEIVDQDRVEKFTFSEITAVDEKQTLWAIYNQNDNIWIPVKYEIIKYDIWLGSKSKHEIWKFHNFDTNFDSSTVFNFEDQYDCQDSKDEDFAKGSNARNKNKIKQNDAINPKNEDHVDLVFNSFKEKYNKIYADEEEHALRRKVFKKNMRLIIKNNRKNTGYKLAINKFADRTPEEIKKYKGLIRSSQRESSTHPFPYTSRQLKDLASNLPSEFDLRDLGVITPVKDQQECGSCWTFGTTSAVEGALARKNGGRLIRLSTQALLDCAWSFGSFGCKGGYDTAAYRWIMEYGLPTEEEYGPYANQDGFCQIGNMTEVYRIRGFTNVTPFSVEALKVALVNHGPLSVSMNAADSMLFYQGGIYYDVDCESTELDHEVTLVGYGQRDGEEYWIVKNSWGQNWGVDGYFHLSVRDNNCGITTEPTYPVL